MVQIHISGIESMGVPEPETIDRMVPGAKEHYTWDQDRCLISFEGPKADWDQGLY